MDGGRDQESADPGRVPEDRPSAGPQPIGTYCCHAGRRSRFGRIWIWSREQRGSLEKNRWCCSEQYVNLNTPGEKNGILRARADGRPAFIDNAVIARRYVGPMR